MSKETKNLENLEKSIEIIKLTTNKKFLGDVEWLISEVKKVKTVRSEKKKLETENKRCRACIKKMWSCSCVRSGYDRATNSKTMFVNKDAAKYGEVLVELKELVEGNE